MNYPFYTPSHKEQTTILEKKSRKFQLIIYNDDVNTFDFVIETLISLCQHDAIQAAQCAELIHRTGKYAVKLGSYKKLVPICSAMLERGLSAAIE